MSEPKKSNKLKVGDIIWSDYFNAHLRIVNIISDDDWYFELKGKVYKAQTTLSYIENHPMESKSMNSEPVNDEIELVTIFETNYLDGDKIQKGQMIATTEIKEYITEFVLPFITSQTKELQTKVEAQEMFTHEAIELAYQQGRLDENKAHSDISLKELEVK